MNILIVSRYFWPEPFIINDLVINLQRLGHNITIFTGKPNYPNGEIYQGYNSFGYQQETYDENINAEISCNDCEFKGGVPFHPVGIKCGGCGGYNTIKIR